MLCPETYIKKNKCYFSHLVCIVISSPYLTYHLTVGEMESVARVFERTDAITVYGYGVCTLVLDEEKRESFLVLSLCDNDDDDDSSDDIETTHAMPQQSDVQSALTAGVSMEVLRFTTLAGAADAAAMVYNEAGTSYKTPGYSLSRVTESLAIKEEYNIEYKATRTSTYM